MQKYYRKMIINLIIILLLIGIPTSIFAVHKSITIGEDLHFTEDIYIVTPYASSFSPGDSMDYITTIKNEYSKQIGIYFVDATEEISDMNLDKVIFSIYIDNVLYKKGNSINLKKELIYVMEPGEEVTQIINVTLDESAGNDYQAKEFNIEWTMEAMEYIELSDNTLANKPEALEPIDDGKYNKNNYITIRDNDKKAQTITGKVAGYIEETLKSLTKNTDKFIMFILITMALLVLIELCRFLRWIIIIILNFKNTRIYVRIKNENEEEQFKLVEKLKTEDKQEIKLDLNELTKQYKTDDFKIIFNKHISKKIDKAKVTIHVKEHSFNYEVTYEKKPIELDINI